MLPGYGCDGAYVSVLSCRRRNPFQWMAFMFAYSVRDTLGSEKHAWMVFKETLSIACNRYLWLNLIYPLKCPFGVWSVGLPQLGGNSPSCIVRI